MRALAWLNEKVANLAHQCCNAQAEREALRREGREAGGGPQVLCGEQAGVNQPARVCKAASLRA